MTRGGGVVVRLKGLHKVRRKLADGSFRTHYYAWRGGPRVEGIPGTPEFIASYNATVAARKTPPKDTFTALIVGYRQSQKHLSLRQNSRREEARHLDTIVDAFGAAPLAAFDDTRMRKDIRQWHEGMITTLRKADLALGVLRKVLDFARQDGLLSLNAAAGHPQLHRANRSEIVWSPEEIEAVCAVSSPELARVILMSAHSGMARIDLCSLRWSEVDEHSIQYMRSKTGALATVPIYPPIRAVLNDAPRRGPCVFTNTRGRRAVSVRRFKKPRELRGFQISAFTICVEVLLLIFIRRACLTWRWLISWGGAKKACDRSRNDMSVGKPWRAR